MSGLSDRLEREPDYRPHCLACSTMRRMTLLDDKRTMWCEPVRDDTFDVGSKLLGVVMPDRFGCGIKFDVFTGETVR